jgi:hypothetical protein
VQVGRLVFVHLLICLGVVVSVLPIILDIAVNLNFMLRYFCHSAYYFMFVLVSRNFAKYS